MYYAVLYSSAHKRGRAKHAQPPCRNLGLSTTLLPAPLFLTVR